VRFYITVIAYNYNYTKSAITHPLLLQQGNGGRQEKLKKVFVLAMAIAIILSGGCDSMKTGRRMNINDEGLEYMEQKYGEKFEYSGSFGDSMSGTHQLLAKSASFPDQNIVVRIENYRSKKKDRVYRDNYLAVKYHTEYTELFQTYATEELGEAYVLCDINTLALPVELPYNATLYEYLADTSVPLAIMVEVKESSLKSEDQVQRFAERIAANGSYFNISFVIVEDSEYSATDIKTLKGLVDSSQYVRYAMISNRDDNGIRIRWL
jgi:hypothetical protein